MQSKHYARGEFPTEEEIAAASRPKGPGCCGLTFKEWGTFIGALLMLYVFLSLLYWALIYAAVEIRSDTYIELPERFFGDFSKVERVLTDVEGNDVFFGDDSPSDGFAEGIRRRTVNYPDGCVVDEDNDRLISCGDGRGQKNQWAIFPWVAVVEPARGCRGQRHTTLVNEGSSLRFRQKGTGRLVQGVCVNGKPKET